MILNFKRVIGTLFFSIFFSLTFSAWYQWDISWWLKQKYYQSIWDEGFYKIAKQFNFWNIYKTIYSNISFKQAKAYKQGVRYLKKILSEKSCGVSDKDIQMILYSMNLNWYGDTIYFQSALNFDNISFSWKRVLNICKKILNCIYSTNKKFSADAVILAKCYDWVYFYLMMWKYNYDIISELKEYNIGNEVLINWDLSDGPFDLLVDIYELRKILFENDDGHIKKPKKIVFYDFSSSEGNDFENGSFDNKYVWDKSNFQGVGWKGNSHFGDFKKYLSENEFYNVDNEEWFNGEGMNSTDGKNKFTDNIVKTEDNNQKLINENKCLTDNKDVVKWKLEEILNNYWWESDKGNIDRKLKDINSSKGLSKSQNWQFVQNLESINPIVKLKDNESNLAQLLDKIHGLFQAPSQSVDKENSFWFWSKHTLCWWKNVSGMLGVSICFIPSWVKVPPKQRVYSIEDILNQILRIAILAKDSGQLMKHAYTDEWWETRLQDIKLSRIFVFDIVIMKKKLFEWLDDNTKQKKEQKKEQEKVLFVDLEHQIWISFWDDMTNKLERNKYVVLWQWKYFFEYNNRYFSKNFVTNIWQSELTNNIQQDLANFFDYNKYYWWEIDKILLQIRKWSAYLYAEVPR